MSADGSTIDDGPPERPSAARMYDYFLGGYHNFAIDRKMAEAASGAYPDLPLVLRANRAFLRRSVTFLSEQGIDQFLDLGSGIPTVGSVHQVAQALNPQAHVVYVDIDPIAVSHGKTLLKDNPTATVVGADLHQPDAILAHPDVRLHLDFARPVAVLMVAVIHFFLDDMEAERVVQVFREAMPAGSYLVMSHAGIEAVEQDMRAQAEAIYARSGNPIRMRTQAEIARFFEGLDLVEPGLVPVPLWRPESPDDLFLDEPERSSGLVGVGRRP